LHRAGGADPDRVTAAQLAEHLQEVGTVAGSDLEDELPGEPVSTDPGARETLGEPAVVRRERLRLDVAFRGLRQAGLMVGVEQEAAALAEDEPERASRRAQRVLRRLVEDHRVRRHARPVQDLDDGDAAACQAPLRGPLTSGEPIFGVIPYAG